MTSSPRGTGLADWVVTGMGLGKLRHAPGTWGSLPPVVLAVALAFAGADPRAIDMALAALGLVFGVNGRHEEEEGGE